MPRSIAKAWIIGVIFAVVVFCLGSLLNLKKSTIAAPACQNQGQVEYVGCPSDRGGEYYVTGWPNEIYCFSDGKDSCSPWSDFLRIDRNNERSQLRNQNLQLIGFFSLLIGLTTTSVILSKNQLKSAKHENTRD